MDRYHERMKKAQQLRSEADEMMLDATVELNQSSTQLLCATNTIQTDVERTGKVLNKAPAILHDIHTQFEMATELRGKDIAFLFGAAALQTARWALLPHLDLDFQKIPTSERMTAAEGAKLEAAGVMEELAKNGISMDAMKDKTYIRQYTWDKLLIAPVPYDAMHGSKDILIPGLSEVGKEIYAKNHHAATWGHDPVYGWFFGPLNITSRTITFRNFQTYRVVQKGNTFNQLITTPSSSSIMLANAIESWSEDSKRLWASVVKQKLHMQSDKFTKTGLPLPFVDAQTAQALLMDGWNSNEMERLFAKAVKNIGIIGAQYAIALTIDQVINALHLLCYNKEIDGAIGEYKLRSQKVVCYSSGLAEVANGFYVATSGDVGKLDIGGYLHFAQTLLSERKLQNQLEAEFLERELYRKVYGEDYYWEEIK